MATHFQAMLADAAQSETRFMAALRRRGLRLMPLDLERCQVHPAEPLQKNWAGLLICNHVDHRPNRGEED